MKVPTELQEILLTELPNVIEQIDEATKQIYDPNSIWLEAMQYADYVSQFATHLQMDHGPECVQMVSEQLIELSTSFKEMAESALQAIDKTEDINDTQF